MLSVLLGKLMSRKSKTTDQGRIDNLPMYDQAAHYINKLKSEQNYAFNPIRASEIAVVSIDNNIEEIILKLINYLQYTTEAVHPTPTAFYNEYVEVTLDQFFTDKEGFYIPATALELFLDVANDLLTSLSQLREKDVSRFNYLSRLLTKTLTSLINICKAIEAARD